MTETSPAHSYCARFHAAIELLGRRWTGPIIVALASGADRFTTIRDTVPGLSDRLLCQRLRELEDRSIVARTQVGRGQNEVRYNLTPKGKALDPVISAISAWANHWPTESP